MRYRLVHMSSCTGALVLSSNTPVPYPNPTRTDNHDNRYNVAPPLSVYTAHPSPTQPDVHSAGATHPFATANIGLGHALRLTPSDLRRAPAAALISGARRGKGLEGEELLRHEGGRPVKRFVDAAAPAHAALDVGLTAQRRVRHADRRDAP